MSRRFPSRPQAGVAVPLALVLSACSTMGGAGPAATVASPQLSESVEPRAASGDSWYELWRLPEDAKEIQASYQFQYGGPDGGATPKIILRLQDSSRFSIAASEFGRRIFTLEVLGDRALFLDHRARSHCWLAGEIELSALPLGALSLRALPALLFDRLPAEAAGAIESVDDEISFMDGQGRSWRVRLQVSSENAPSTIAGWTVLNQERPEVWLVRRGETRFLSARDLQLRWKKGHSEPLSQPLTAPVPPARYAEDCRDFSGGP